MPDTVVNAPPFVPVKPLLKVGAVGAGVEFECSAETIKVDVTQADVTTETFCGIFKSYKAEEWVITNTVFPSYGTAGLWNNLRPLVGTSQPFTFQPDGVAVVGPANPAMTGTCRVKAFSFYAGKLGEPQSFDVELAVQGIPTWALTFAELDAAFAEAEKVAASYNAAANGTANGGTEAAAPADSKPAASAK
jgi:hypothetical protein